MAEKDFRENANKFELTPDDINMMGETNSSVMAALENYYRNLSWLMYDIESITNASELPKDVYQALIEMQTASETVLHTIEDSLDVFEKHVKSKQS